MTRLAERCIGVIVVVALTLVCSGCPGGGGGGSITVSGGKVDFGDPWFETPDKLCVKVTVSQGAANVIVDVTVGAQGGHTSHFNIPPGMYKICEDLPGSLTDGAHFTVKKSVDGKEQPPIWDGKLGELKKHKPPEGAADLSSAPK